MVENAKGRDFIGQAIVVKRLGTDEFARFAQRERFGRVIKFREWEAGRRLGNPMRKGWWLNLGAYRGTRQQGSRK
jgi:hypothetical protein